MQLRPDGFYVKMPTGVAISADNNSLILTTKDASISVSDSVGVTVTSSKGALLNVSDSAIVASGATVAVTSGQSAFAAEKTFIGPENGNFKRIPSALPLYDKLEQLAAQVDALSNFCRSHTHPVIAQAAAPSLSAAALPTTIQQLKFANPLPDCIESVEAV
jgi:hypothetical protein